MSDEGMAQLAIDYTAALEPPWWKPFKRKRFRRTHSAVETYLAVRDALVGEAEPIKKFGVRIDE